jgi:hypothetical protein
MPAGPESGKGGASGSPARGSSWRAWVGLVISALALGGCLIWALGQPAPQIPTSPRALSLLVLGLAVYSTSMLLRGLRWITSGPLGGEARHQADQPRNRQRPLQRGQRQPPAE